MSTSDEFHVYDTTLRDGAQQEGLALSVADKIAIAQHLDDLGVGFIEGGWPGRGAEGHRVLRAGADRAAPAARDLRRLRRDPQARDDRAADDPQVAALRDSGAAVVTLVAKSHDAHVERALRTTLDENLRMVADTVQHLREHGQRVFLDTEHFFDGYRANRAYAAGGSTGRRARQAPMSSRSATPTAARCRGSCRRSSATSSRRPAPGSASTPTTTAAARWRTRIAAVEAGGTHVQGTINGYGERTGNADLLAVVANLELKRGMELLPPGKLAESFRIAHAIAEVTNVPPSTRQPYVGVSAFAHKAGLHASAIKVDPDLYQHTDPALVGNDMRMLVSEMAGRASVELKGRELGFDLGNDRDLVSRVTDGSRRWSRAATPSRPRTRRSSCC